MKAHSYICDLTPYEPGLPIDVVVRQHGLDPAKVVKLASNENPLGMSPKAKKALQEAVEKGHTYPDQHQLTQKLASKLGVSPENIVLGNGSNDVLDLVARSYLKEGSQAVSARYAFAIYAIVSQSSGAENIIVPGLNFGHDLDAMLEAVTSRTRVIWIANPNNPTGTFIPNDEIKKFLERVPEDVVVVLDEAYKEYLDEADRTDTLAWLKEHPNLVVTRTFSKAYGLAGLRVGYGVASPEVAGLLNRVRQPFNTNSLALAAALAALDDDEFVAKTAELNRQGRAQLIEGLRNLGLCCLPAHGNFVTFRVLNTAETHQELLKNGIIVRPLATNGMPGWLRVTVGTHDQNERFLRELKELLS